MVVSATEGSFPDPPFLVMFTHLPPTLSPGRQFFYLFTDTFSLKTEKDGASSELIKKVI